MKNPTPQPPIAPTFDDLLDELSESRPPAVGELLPSHALDALALQWLIDPKRAAIEERSLAAVADAVLASAEAWQ